MKKNYLILNNNLNPLDTFWNRDKDIDPKVDEKYIRKKHWVPKEEEYEDYFTENLTTNASEDLGKKT